MAALNQGQAQAQEERAAGTEQGGFQRLQHYQLRQNHKQQLRNREWPVCLALYPARKRRTAILQEEGFPRDAWSCWRWRRTFRWRRQQEGGILMEVLQHPRQPEALLQVGVCLSSTSSSGFPQQTISFITLSKRCHSFFFEVKLRNSP